MRKNQNTMKIAEYVKKEDAVLFLRVKKYRGKKHMKTGEIGLPNAHSLTRMS